MNNFQKMFAVLVLTYILYPTSFVFSYFSPGQPTGYVNDFSGVLSGGIKTELEQKLVQFHTDTTNEVVVVLVPTIGDDYIESYTLSLAEDWKIADSKKDNAVILLLATDDRKVRVEVGYGLEGVLPDSVANSIIREMVPSLKEGNYDAAVTDAVGSIIAATKDEYTATGETGDNSFGDIFPILFFFFVVSAQWLASILGRTKDWWLGGVLGFSAGSIFAVVSFMWGLLALSLLASALVIIALTLFGLFFDYVVSSTYGHAKRYGYDTPWWAGGNTSWGSSSGGFGGFGGGGSSSFGGGGSSGSW
jgi:uncharacterized protein